MRKTRDIEFDKKRMLSDPDVADYLNVCQESARRLCEQAGAVRRFGRRRLNDRIVLDQYLDSLNNGQKIKVAK